jgi:MFS family permease
MIVGRLTDLFGRRWFFIGGGFLGILGSIVCATAPNINAMIASVTLIGLASSAQLSFSFAVAELVPMKYRYMAIGYIYLWNTPLSGFGSAAAYGFVYKTSVGWRGCFYLLIAMNVVATASWYLFYFPPNFQVFHIIVRNGGAAS